MKWISSLLSDEKGQPSTSRVSSFLALFVALSLAVLATFGYDVKLDFFLLLLGYSLGQKTFDKLISRLPNGKAEVERGE